MQCHCCGEWHCTYSFTVSQKGYCEAIGALERVAIGKGQCKYCIEYPSNHWLDSKPESEPEMRGQNEGMLGGTLQNHRNILATMVVEGRRGRAEGLSLLEEERYTRQVRDELIHTFAQDRKVECA